MFLVERSSLKLITTCLIRPYTGHRKCYGQAVQLQCEYTEQLVQPGPGHREGHTELAHEVYDGARGGTVQRRFGHHHQDHARGSAGRRGGNCGLEYHHEWHSCEHTLNLAGDARRHGARSEPSPYPVIERVGPAKIRRPAFRWTGSKSPHFLTRFFVAIVFRSSCKQGYVVK